MNAWQKTKAVHMSVLSSDLKLIGFENRIELHLSSDLICPEWSLVELDTRIGNRYI